MYSGADRDSLKRKKGVRDLLGQGNTAVTQQGAFSVQILPKIPYIAYDNFLIIILKGDIHVLIELCV